MYVVCVVPPNAATAAAAAAAAQNIALQQQQQQQAASSASLALSQQIITNPQGQIVAIGAAQVTRHLLRLLVSVYRA